MSSAENIMPASSCRDETLRKWLDLFTDKLGVDVSSRRAISAISGAGIMLHNGAHARYCRAFGIGDK